MSNDELTFEPETTALVVVDLQNFTIAMNTVPTPASQVLANSIRLARACRSAGIQVVLVRVGHDAAKVPPVKPVTDASFSGFEFGPGAKEIPQELGPEDGDIVVDKYNWGAFHGTNLDIHLRRRGIRTLIVTGLVTNVGVDTTMRHAHERGYDQVMVSDAVAAMTQEEHDYTCRIIAPRLARVRTTEQVLAAI
ncbi:isochorismatase family protein [Altererythrobacter sp. C41]|uniref:isochorismatase family protein n=1 Tax=Altererythrobacter sp. C41 TaxID=2806021 RepID=UPI001933276F|nr:isochorismatase family protein [Altererythrobacter sp. C41]MBM0171265.1 isochorismatase family protein [Altererythrobacter sp. C41]